MISFTEYKEFGISDSGAHNLIDCPMYGTFVLTEFRQPKGGEYYLSIAANRVCQKGYNLLPFRQPRWILVPLEEWKDSNREVN